MTEQRAQMLELADWVEKHGFSHFNLEFGIGREARKVRIELIVAALRLAAQAVSPEWGTNVW